MRKTLDRSDQQPEGQGVHYAVAPVEATVGEPDGIVRQETHAEPDGRDADRNIDGEEPVPRRHRKNRGRERRPRHRGDGHHRGIDAHAAPQLVARVDDTDDRRIDTHHSRTAESLNHPHGDQHFQRAGKSAAYRREGEEDESADVDAAVADDIAQRRKTQQRNDDRQLIGIDHPDRIGRRDSQLVGDRRQRDIGDRTVQYRQRHAERDGQNRPQSARHRQPVPFGIAYDLSCHDSCAALSVDKITTFHRKRLLKNGKSLSSASAEDTSPRPYK